VVHAPAGEPAAADLAAVEDRHVSAPVTSVFALLMRGTARMASTCAGDGASTVRLAQVSRTRGMVDSG
jgi:hypothetical protein